MMRIGKTFSAGLLSAGMATVALGTAPNTASADVLALYDFSEFSSQQADDYFNPGSPANGGVFNYLNHAVSAADVSSLHNNEMASLVANTTRDSTNEPVGPVALLIAAGGMPTRDAADINAETGYLGFTVTTNAGWIELDNLAFDLGTSAGAGTNAAPDFTTVETHAQLFYSTDGGTTFSTVGSLISSIADNANNEGVFTGMNNYQIDLSSLGNINAGETVEFRLGFADNRGGGTTNMGHYLDNVTLNGAVVPEPASMGLLGLAGAGLLIRRRRA